jgi:hypothetical protein
MTITLQTLINSAQQTVNENVVAYFESTGMTQAEALELLDKVDAAEASSN